TPLANVWNSLKERPVTLAHFTTFFFLAGHFSLYGYLTPFVTSQLGFSGGLLTAVYFIYGIAAVTGGGLAGFFSDSFTPRRTLLIGTGLLLLCLVIMPFSTHGLFVFWAVLIIFGVLSYSITPTIHSQLVLI